MSKLIISYGITGSRIQKKDTPFIPITPEEIAVPSIEAVRAGASVIHIHVRDPETNIGTQDRKLYKKVLTRIKEEVNPIICLTTTGVPGKNIDTHGFTPVALQRHLLSFRHSPTGLRPWSFANF